jgi:peroxiredoxin
MLQVGQEAPAFELPGAAAGRIDSHALSEYADNGWAVVLVFYPFDFPPSCTDELCVLRDAKGLSLVENTVVFSISTDSAHSHRAFSQDHRIDFPLLSDSDGQVHVIGLDRKVLDVEAFVLGNVVDDRRHTIGNVSTED